jgi:serine/threonine-protein kinase PpkA
MQASQNDPAFDSPERPVEDPVIPGYRVVRKLGLGGMATVYLAVQESLDREVAIKVMRPSRQLDEAQSQRFEHEARIIAKLQHPSIVVIHEVGRTQQGDLYYVMPYLAKGDLSVRDFRDDEEGLIALLGALLDALGYAHARGIVHRDVKPENVLFDNADRPQLADFGIALSPNEIDSRITGDGLAIGSGAQMSPEQARADTVDGRSDLYSLGVLTYELLTGELPFNSTDSLALALMHAQDPVPRLPADKDHWQAFVDCAMAKRPEQRFRNAQAMQRALEPVRRHLRRSAAPMGRLRHAMANRPPLLIATGLLLAVSLVSLALPYLGRSGSGPTEPIASDGVVKAVGDNKAVSELKTLASEQISIGALQTPAGANAAETYLVMLGRDPGNSDAIAGIDAVINALIGSIIAAENDGDLAAVRDSYLKIETTADRAGARDRASFTDLRSQLASAFVTQIGNLADAGKSDDAIANLSLAHELGFDDAKLDALEERLKDQPATGQVVRDPGGPAMLLVPARLDGSTIAKAFMMMRNEVSRSDYAVFARSTNRESSRCRNALSPLRLFDRRDWKDPGFRQTSGDPVVCVSFDDARAYANWLGRRTGQSYRLPSKSEWLHAEKSSTRAGSVCARGNIRDRSASGGGARASCNDGFANTSPSGRFQSSSLGINDLYGNVSEWTSSCGSAENPIARSVEKDSCPRRAALGSSWQDGPDVAASQQRLLPPDRGYDDIGFRLIRAP